MYSILGKKLPAMHTLDLNTASQQSIQKQIHYNVFNSLMENGSLRNKARLNTTLSNHAGAWLWALPNSNLGLTIPPHEFVNAIRTWLDIAMFLLPPSSISCCRGTTIDPFSDHLISCHKSPLRVQCHSALCEVIFQALLKKNKTAQVMIQADQEMYIIQIP